jgi:competence protein ComEC
VILGVPFALLAALWLTWNADATADGDPTARGFATGLAMVLAGLGAVVTWRARTGQAVAVGLALLAASTGTLRGTLAVRNDGPTSPVVTGVIGMRATVLDEPEWRTGGMRIRVHVEAVSRTAGTWEVADGPATIRAPASVVVAPGDIIEAIPRAATRTSFAVRDVRLIGSAIPSSAPDFMTSLRRQLAAPIETWLPEPEAALATGTLLGDRTGVPAPIRNAFNITGATHLVAISGWNVSLVAAMIGWLTTRGRPRRQLRWQIVRALATSAALWSFVALVGASGSVLRAAVMAQLGLLARMSQRRAAVAGTLLWGAVIVTMVNPPTLDDVGWQLSFLGAAGLVWLAPWIETRMVPPPGARWRWLVPAGVRVVVAGAIAAQVCVLPVLAGTLGSVPLLGLAATTPGLLLIPPLMAGSAVLSLAGTTLARWPMAPDWLMPTLGTLAWAPTTLLVRLVEWAATLPGASATSQPWHPLAMVAYLFGLALLVMAAETPPRVPAPRSHQSRARPLLIGLGTVVAAAVLLVVPGAELVRAASGASTASSGALAIVAGSGPNARVIVPSLAGQSDGTLAIIAMPRGPRLMVGGGPTVDAGVQALGTTIRPWDQIIDAVVLHSAEVESSAGVARATARYRVGTIIDLTNGSDFGLMPSIRAHARSVGITITKAGNGVPVVVGDVSRVPDGPCPATSFGAAVVVPIGASPPRLGSGSGPSAWPSVAVRVCAGWADVTIVPDVTGASIWLAHATPSETFSLVAPSGRPRWVVVPWRAWHSDALDSVRQAIGASLVVVQGAPEPWRPSASRPESGRWWIAALDGPLDVGDDR